MARRWGHGRNDCVAPALLNHDVNCKNYMEWNARTQLTTWKPTPVDAASIPDGPIIDYAGKHWNGLIRDYYARRAELTLELALNDDAARRAFNATEMERRRARHAYNWTTATGEYPTTPVGDAVEVSVVMREKYKGWFASCGGGGGGSDVDAEAEAKAEANGAPAAATSSVA
uniref:Alpha-N-acetylglucosaminidase C-terminal domain-containing protein n=1 Tax=Odontella aurita TaxID=265563 RepID=A0A7S4MND2_9STRA|mmetsp:Transcript_26917/g.79555  ORF Transcript_26917/g.79555 Transcript_26917/m.79555 type:complete len:172 (+) Transcript_26917:357-872(+)